MSLYNNNMSKPRAKELFEKSSYVKKILGCAVKAREPNMSPIGEFSVGEDVIIALRVLGYVEYRSGGWVATSLGVEAFEAYTKSNQ